MNGKKIKQLRKSVIQGFGNVDAEYKLINDHMKQYGVDPITQEPLMVRVQTAVLTDTCGRKALKQMKKLYKG